MKTLQDYIETIINNTFNAIDEVYKTNQESAEKGNSRLVFPKYRSDKTRVSEQELRFIFVDQFIQYCNNSDNHFDYYYSVETPTRYKYKFYRDNGKVPEVSTQDGKSASHDLTIFSKEGKSVAVLEFKKDGCSAHEIAKDFLKLSVEPNDDQVEMLRFFVMISASNTDLEKQSNNEKEIGLLQHFKNKLNNDCFNLKKNNQGINSGWHSIDLFWHRLPLEQEVDSNDFAALYNVTQGIYDIKI